MLDPIAVVHESGYETVISRRSLRAYRKHGYRPASEVIAAPAGPPTIQDKQPSNQTGGSWGRTATFDLDES